MLNYFGIDVKGVDRETKRVQGVVIVDLEGYRYIMDNGIAVDGYIISVEDHGLERSVARAIVYTKSLYIRPVRRVVVGIDYGKSIGVAVLVNDDVVYTRSYRSKEEVLRDIRFFIENIDSEVKIVRLGVAQDIDEDFAESAIDILKDIANIEFVPEFKSSKNRYLLDDAKLKPDEVAAINIALYRSSAD